MISMMANLFELDIVLALGKCIMDFVLFFWFSSQFFIPRQDKSKFYTLLVILVLSIWQFFINNLHYAQLNTASAIGCVMIINFSLFKSHFVSQLMCSLAEALLIVICEFIPISFYSIINGSDIATTANKTIQNAGFNLISTGIFSIVIISTNYFILKKRKKYNRNISITENLSIAVVPLVSMCVIYNILDVNIGNVKTSSNILVFVGLLLMNIIVISGDNNLRKRYQLQWELDELNRMEHLNKVIIAQQDQFIENMKGFAHDYTKQLNGLKNLYAGENENLVGNDFDKYQSEIYNYIEESYYLAYIPNHVLRSILSQAQLLCNNAKITLELDIQYTDFSFIKFPDMYSLFENSLENAITACNEIQDEHIPKNIHLAILRKKNMVWVELANTKTNPIQLKGDKVQTTKVNSFGHGFGIKNMRRVIQRYNGYLNIEYNQNSFYLTMVFPVPKVNQ